MTSGRNSIFLIKKSIIELSVIDPPSEKLNITKRRTETKDIIINNNILTGFSFINFIILLNNYPPTWLTEGV